MATGAKRTSAASGDRGRAAARQRDVVADGAAEVPDGVPLTERGRRTRAKMVAAARKVFEERGFLETRVADIASAAGVAHGTFYTYFDSKEEIFKEVALALQRDLLTRPTTDGSPAAPSVYERIERANRHYLESYQRNAALMAIIEQVATFNPTLRTIRRDLRRAHVERAEAGIRRLQRQGLAAKDVDAEYAANALGAMVDRFAYIWLVLGEDFELDRAVRSLSVLWARALGIEVPPAKRRRKAPAARS